MVAAVGYQFAVDAAIAGEAAERRVGDTGTFDAARYRDPQRFAAEVARCLDRSWVVCDHATRLAADGDYVVWDGWGRSVVVTRHAGRLHAFDNVCRHRGARLVDGPGRCPDGVYRCPWHGWTYDARGDVTSVPRRSLFADSQITRHAAPIGVAELWGFVWINLAGDEAEPLEAYVAELADELGGYAFDTWQLVGTDEWDVSCNWKTLVDGFGEDYHARDVHAATIPKGLEFEATRWRLFERHSMMVTPLHGVDYAGMEQPVDHRATAYCHYSIFPTTILSCFPSHAQVMSVVPTSVGRTRFRVWITGRAEPGDARRQRQLAEGQEHFRRIAAEDLGIIERVSSASVAPTFTRVEFGRAERRLTLFHSVLDEALGDAPPGPA